MRVALERADRENALEENTFFTKIKQLEKNVALTGIQIALAKSQKNLNQKQVQKISADINRDIQQLVINKRIANIQDLAQITNEGKLADLMKNTELRKTMIKHQITMDEMRFLLQTINTVGNFRGKTTTTITDKGEGYSHTTKTEN